TSFSGNRCVLGLLRVRRLHVPHQLMQIEPHHRPIATCQRRLIELHPTSAQAKGFGMLDQGSVSACRPLSASTTSGGGRCLMLAGRCTPSALILSASMALMLLAL